MPSETEQAVRCACGEVLLDAMDDSHVKFGDDEFRFRRTTDFVGCPTCGTLYSVRDLKPGINQPGENVPVEPVTDPLEELRKLADEIDGLAPPAFDIDGDEVIADPNA